MIRLNKDDWFQQHYIYSIQALKKGNMDIYNELLVEIFGKKLKWSEVKQQDQDKLIKLWIELDNRIKLKKSPIDVKKLSSAIQSSRSGIGGCAMTKFNCAFCNKEEWWGNTAVPRICKECATKMATNIAMYFYDILKEEK